MPKTHIECHGIADDWIRVEDGDDTHFVNTITIAGTDLSIPYAGQIDIECEAYTIEGDYAPALLIESASWYTPPDERPTGCPANVEDDSYTVDVSRIAEIEFYVDDDIRVSEFELDGDDGSDGRRQGVAVTRQTHTDSHQD